MPKRVKVPSPRPDDMIADLHAALRVAGAPVEIEPAPMTQEVIAAAVSATAKAPERFDEKYRPRRLKDFVGMERERKILTEFLKKPYTSAWFLLGPSGVGKTTMALALADELKAEIQHIPSRTCDLETINEAVRRCWNIPMFGERGYHALLIDEADKMTLPAQLSLLSKLDATAMPPQTLFLFTANDTSNLEDRFLSRCRVIEFDTSGMLEHIAALLARVWSIERPGDYKPDFMAIAAQSGLNVRRALMNLEMEALSPGSFRVAPPPPPPEVPAFQKVTYIRPASRSKPGVDQSRSESARRAWETMRSPEWLAKQAEKKAASARQKQA